MPSVADRQSDDNRPPMLKHRRPNSAVSKVSWIFSSEDIGNVFIIKRRGVSPSPTWWWASCWSIKYAPKSCGHYNRNKCISDILLAILLFAADHPTARESDQLMGETHAREIHRQVTFSEEVRLRTSLFCTWLKLTRRLTWRSANHRLEFHG